MTDPTTARYRKLPVEIEARQLTAESYREFIESLTVEEFAAGGETEDGAVFLEIRTLEGVMRASEGDWIIRGVKGELYPCRDDIFRATYEPVLTGTERASLSEGRALARCDRDEALAAAAGVRQDGAQPAEELLSGTQPCGHDDYHDPHEWHERPHVWCPGVGYDEPAVVESGKEA